MKKKLLIIFTLHFFLFRGVL